jgi:hypothetical protein
MNQPSLDARRGRSIRLHPQRETSELGKCMYFVGRRARAFRFSPLRPRGSSQTVLHCARHSHPPNPERAETRSCPKRAPSFWMIIKSSLASLPWNGTRVAPPAAVERAHSDRARSGSKGSTRVSFHPFHRARSASKKDGLAAPLPFS